MPRMRCFLPSALLVAGLACTASVMALETLSEDQLAQTTGQDGLTIAVSPVASPSRVGQIGVNTINYWQRNNATGSISIANNSFSPEFTSSRTPGMSSFDAPGGGIGINFRQGGGIRFCADTGASLTTCNTPSTRPIVLTVDADGNRGSPVLAVNIALQSDLRRIRLDVSTISRKVVNAGTSAVPDTDILRLVRAGTNDPSIAGININFARTDANGTAIAAPSLALLLGNTPNGRGMIQLGSFNIASINTDEWYLPSYTTSTDAATGIRFTPILEGLDLSGARINMVSSYGGSDQGGMLLTRSGYTTIDEVGARNISFGDIGATNADVFAGTANASIGTVGITGLRMTNLQVKVNGF